MTNPRGLRALMASAAVALILPQAQADTVASWTNASLNVDASIPAAVGTGSIVRGPGAVYQNVADTLALSHLNDTTEAAAVTAGDYAEVAVNTATYDTLVLSYTRVLANAQAAPNMQVKYSVNGVAGPFINPTLGSGGFFNTTTTPQATTVDVSDILAANNNANLVFRIYMWGSGNSGAGTQVRLSNFIVTGGQNSPQLDLNGGDPGIDYNATFTEGGGAVPIVDSLNLTLTDPNSADLAGATISISNLLDAGSEVLAANTGATSILANYTPGTGVLTLTGTDSVANYQQVLQSVTYDNVSASPDSTLRDVTFVVSDGILESPTAHSFITVNTVNDPPSDIDISNDTVDENAVNGTVVGTLSAVDPDGDTPLVFTLLNDAGGRFALVGDDIQVADGSLLDYETDTSHNILVEVADPSAATYQESLTILINNVNEPPTAINYEGDAVDENAANGTLVSQIFNADDPDAGDAITYTLLDNAGGRFQIVVDQIQVADGSLLDYETNTSHQVTVQAEDSGGLTFSDTITIFVLNVNEVPTDINLPTSTVNENAANGTVVGTFETTDPDFGDTFSYNLLNDAGGRFALNGANLEVANGSLLDYETNTSHDVFVEVTDAGGLTRSELFTITVLNVNEAPTDINLSNNTVDENALNGTVVGGLSAVDQDAGDSHTFVLTDTAGGRFGISGNNLVVADGSLLDFETNSSHNVTVEATDLGGLTFSEAFTVNLNNVNEAPTDINLIGSGDVLENAANGSLIALIQGTDPESDSLTFTLLDNAGGRFAVSGAVLQVADGSLLDYETNTSHNITIQAEDTGALTYNESFTITVLNVNEAPTDIQLSDNNVPAQSATGTVVGTLTATDPDVGDSLTFSLPDDALGRFQVVGNELQVLNGTILNDNDVYNVTVRAQDTGALFVDEIFQINVTPVNDPPTDILLSNSSVAENSPNGTLVGTLTAVDPDIGDTFTYTLLDNAGGRFQIVGDELQVADGSLLNFEVIPFHFVLIQVQDSGGATFAKPFLITITNVNEAPTDIALSNDTVPENSANGTPVGIVSSSDPDIPDNNFYTLTNNAGGRFQLIANQLAVADGSLLDFETAGSHLITIQAQDLGGLTYSEDFTITITNVNEAPTDIALTGSTVVENAANGSLVGTLSSTDPDAGDLALYSLTDTAGGRFLVVGDEVRVADGSLLNFEANTSHQITVQVQDGGGLFYSENFTISVTNANEAPIDIDLLGSVVAENAANGTPVGTLSSTDPDGGDTAAYSLTDSAGGRFAVVGAQIQVADGSLLNFEANTSHNVTVQVQDGGGLTFSEVFLITVTDVNEAPTDIVLAGSSVAENSPNGTLVGTLSASDPDAGDIALYSLTDTAGGRFAIVGTELRVANGTLLNFEADTSHNVTVQVQDGGGLVFSEVFLITVTNVNEAPTDIALAGLTVVENAANGTVVGTLSSIDPDGSDTAAYILTDDAGGRFTVLGDEVRVADGSLLDFETNTSHQITVQVQDAGGLTFSESFTITVTNANEAPTDIVLSNSSVAENSATGTPVGNLSASDPDVGDTFTFSLTDDAGGRFQIAGNELQAADGSLLDFETNASHDVTVEVTDAGGLTFSETFTITLTDVNEAPTDIALSNSTIQENSATGAPVGNLSAADPDAGDTSTFSLTDDAGGRFQIVGTELQVADGSLLDFESDTSHQITVEVQDAGGLIFSESFTITVTNENEAPTDIVLSNSSVAENSATGTPIGNLSASDPDAGETFTFSLTDDAGGRFQIVGTELQVADGSLLDFESDTSHQITVEVQDAGGLIFSESFTITVTNENEAPTDIALAGTTVNENAANGTVVGSLSATDPDAGATFTFSLADDAGGRFAVIGTQLQVADGSLLDFEANTSHQVTVEAQDQGGLIFAESFTISVLNVNEAPTDIALAGSSVVENSPNGTVVGTLSGTDPDAGDTLTFSLTDNAGGRFTVAGNQIQVADGTLLDFETNPSHNVTVQAQDTGGLTFSEVFTITVSNAGNEGPTDVILDGGVAGTNVNENAPIGTLIGTFTVSDPDSGDTFTFTLTDDAGGRFTVVGNQLQVANGSLLDFETNTSHNVTVLIADSGSESISRTFTINVLNVNENPTDIALTNANIDENVPAGTVVGDLSATDPDAGDTFTFSLSDSAGGRFAVNGNQLVTAGSIDFESSPFNVTVVVTDTGGLTFSETFSITVNNLSEPPVTVEDLFFAFEDQDLPIPAPGVLGNDFDPDGAQIQAAVVTNPSHGTLTFQSDGSFLYTPNANYAGIDTFFYTASDGVDVSGPTTVTIQIADLPDADLSLLKTATPDPAHIGERLTYTITVTNVGTEDAPAVSVLDVLPAGLTVVSVSAPCTNEFGGLLCSLGAVPIGGAASMTIETIPTQQGVLTNVATVLLPQPDPDTSNDTGSVSVTVGAPLNGPDLTGNFISAAATCRTRPDGTIVCSAQGRVRIFNQGNERAGSKSTARVFLSDDAILDGGDQSLIRRNVKKLKPGQGKNMKFNVRAVEGQVFTGKYLILIADQANQVAESIETNNIVIFGPLP